MGMVVTIDGPAASGKSTVSRQLAQRLGWKWVSTGAFYRGLSYVALQMGVDLDSPKDLVALVENPIWAIQLTSAKTLVLYKNQDVTDHIAQESVGNAASKISHYPEVRKALLESQRSCAMGPDGLVAEGRDCGTVVFPTAQAKIYLTASSENRAARRALELGMDQQEIIEAQKQRDRQDSTRKAAPMQVPENAMVVDTTELGLEEVVNQVESYVREKLATAHQIL